jgi:lauroyl/myristoyl acyltransferase
MQNPARADGSHGAPFVEPKTGVPQSVLRALALIPLRQRFQLIRWWFKLVPRVGARGLKEIDAHRLRGLEFAQALLLSSAPLPELVRQMQPEFELRWALTIAAFLERGPFRSTPFMTFHGLQSAREAAAKRPLVFLSSHYGAYSVLPAILVDLKPRILCVATSGPGDLFMSLGARFRSALPRLGSLQFLSMPRNNAILDLVLALRRGDGVLLAIDTYAGGTKLGRQRSFLGSSLYALDALAALNRRVPFDLIYAFVDRSQDVRAGRQFEVKMETIPSETFARAPEAVLDDLLTRTERQIRERPERWTLWRSFPYGGDESSEARAVSE